ncbi:MAG: prevent-host-death protein [Deltaproteobacteria bacterium]|jgi:PHD/YefM family antitoxin component YafN of YafNO toxin-antitoxin module|nr:prevent-host-death protein [Deltaproteobacteria bacterium]
MLTIAAQEIKRRGISAVDDLLNDGPVHIIKNNQPQYVVITEERYQEFVKTEDQSYLARVKASLKELKKGNVQKFANVDDLLLSLETGEEKP